MKHVKGPASRNVHKGASFPFCAIECPPISALQRVEQVRNKHGLVNFLGVKYTGECETRAQGPLHLPIRARSTSREMWSLDDALSDLPSCSHLVFFFFPVFIRFSLGCGLGTVNAQL